MRCLSLVFALAVAATALLTQATPVPPAVAGQLIPGHWIITLHPDIDTTSHILKVRQIHARNTRRSDGAQHESGGVLRQYGFGNFKGYAGSFDAATIGELRNLPEVLAIEEDSIMTINGFISQSNPKNWGLPAISSRVKGATDYVYDSSAGEGYYNYVIDTGIRATHQEFADHRVVWGHNLVDKDDDDKIGHGTHIAGIMIGANYGVAKKSTAVAVKVFNTIFGKMSIALDGLNWSVKDIVEKNRTNTAVINISSSGLASTAWDTAITEAWDQGVLVVASAGNADQDASKYSPGRSPEVICVGGLRNNYSRYGGPWGSNYGSAIDIWAPGHDIVSAGHLNDTATVSFTGTSMAAPHVAGLVSYIRGLEGPLNASAVKERVLELAIPDRVHDAKGSANLVAYNNACELPENGK